MKAIASEIIERATLLIVRGHTDEEVETKLSDAENRAQVRDAIAEARERIVRAATFSRISELGAAKLRLEQLYRNAEDVSEFTVAMQALKELHRLLDLFAKPSDGNGQSVGEEVLVELETIGAHLRGVSGLPESAPIVEHARVVADLARRFADSDKDIQN